MRVSAGDLPVVVDLPQYSACDGSPLDHIDGPAFTQIGVKGLRPQSISQTVNLTLELQDETDTALGRLRADVQPFQDTADGRDEVDESFQAVERSAGRCIHTRAGRLVHDIKDLGIVILSLDQGRMTVESGQIPVTLASLGHLV